MKTTTKKTIKTLSKSLVVAGILTAMSAPVVAKGYNNNHTSFQYGQVVRTTPVIENYQVNNPIEECWDERVETRSQASRSRTPQILGGLIGAAIGNKVGRGRGKDLATVAGVVLGTSIGTDVRNKSQRRGSTYQVVQRCEVRDSYSTQERIVGYDVAYRFNGDVFHTQMAQRPGKRIKLRVSFSPV